MSVLPVLLVSILLPTEKHDYASSNYVKPCSLLLRSSTLWGLKFGLLYWGLGNFLGLVFSHLFILHLNSSLASGIRNFSR